MDKHHDMADVVGSHGSESPNSSSGSILGPSDPASLALLLVSVGVTTIIGWWVLAELTSPLRRYPGPFLARWTNWWRFALVRTGNVHTRMKELHDKYGPVVRMGPNLLDLDYPELIKVLYGTDGKWHKASTGHSPTNWGWTTEFYHNNSAVIDGRITYHLFSGTRQEEHSRMKRPIVKYYSHSGVLTLEPLMTEVVSDFCDVLEQRFMKEPGSEAFDLGEWIAFYSWDMNGVASFSQRFGYMDKGHDYDETISIAEKALDYFAAVGQMPLLDFLLDKNPLKRIGPPNLGNVTRIALEHLMARMQDKYDNFNPEVPDFLQHFINSKNTNPDLVNDGTIMGYLLVNLLAGADTTAITIRAVFYYILRNPQVYQKLEVEILAGGFGKVVPYSSARALPYLEAVVREATRMHPGVCMLLERYVPATGLSLPDSSFVPGGTAVGINPYVNGRNKSIWGDDVDVFRPERWLRGGAPGARDETEGTYRERMKLFNAGDLTFGGGSRVCIGRNVALVEVYKVVATLANRYEIELVDARSTWAVTGSWSARQKGGLDCKLRKRL